MGTGGGRGGSLEARAGGAVSSHVRRRRNAHVVDLRPVTGAHARRAEPPLDYGGVFGPPPVPAPSRHDNRFPPSVRPGRPPPPPPPPPLPLPPSLRLALSGRSDVPGDRHARHSRPFARTWRDDGFFIAKNFRPLNSRCDEFRGTDEKVRRIEKIIQRNSF